MYTHSNYWGGIQPNHWGEYIPPSPLVSAPLVAGVHVRPGSPGPLSSNLIIFSIRGIFVITAISVTLKGD